MLSVLCLDACERYHVFTKKVHYQTTGRGVRCFESSASIKGIGIVESYGRRRRVCHTSSDQPLYEHDTRPQYEKT